MNTKTFTIAAVTALVLGIGPQARADDQGCTNANLKGTFSHIGTGFITAPAGTLAGVGTDTFDGNGDATETATLSINGKIVSLTATGTYNVNPDCTGTYIIQGPGGTTTLFFVIDDGGNEVKAVCTDPGVVITHIFRRQFPEGD